MRGKLRAFLVDSSPAVVLEASTAPELAELIAAAGTELDDGIYWANRLRDR